MRTGIQPIRFVLWIFIGLFLTIGAGLYWKSQGENQGQAATTVNSSRETMMTSDLVGYWTLDGNDIVWSDANEIKDVNPGTKHDGNVVGSLAAGSAISGRSGQGLRFNGTSDTISLGNVYNGVKTVAFWAKPDATTEPFIDLNGTATIDVTSGVVAANNFTAPTVYVDGAALTGPASAAPTFVAEYPTAFDNSSSPKTAMNAVSINSGDVLVAVSADEGMFTLGETENGSASWVNIRNSDEYNYTAVRSSGYTATATETLTATITSTGGYFGGNIIRFSGSDGIGASAGDFDSTGSPSVSITTTQDNSAIVVIVGDWSAVSGTQTFTNNGGAGNPTNLTDFLGDDVHYGVGIAYYPDAGTAGAKTVGMSAPTGQKWTIHAIEVKGSVVGDTPLDTGWHYIVATTGTGINASAASIGKIASSYFGGTIDDIRFYSTALSASQVADLYGVATSAKVINAGQDDVLTDGLVGYWTFDGNDVNWGDTSSEIKDVSGSGNHGNASGLTTTSVTLGKLGQGLSFDGASDRIALSNDALPAIADGSVSLWVKTTSDTGNSPFSVNRSTNCASSFDGWGLYVGNGTSHLSNALITLLQSYSSNYDVAYVTANRAELFDGNWHHIVITNDTSSKMYLDGVSKTVTVYWSENGGFLEMASTRYYRIGSCGDNASFFNGSIDDVRVYNRVLSATEVTNLYNIGK